MTIISDKELKRLKAIECAARQWIKAWGGNDPEWYKDMESGAGRSIEKIGRKLQKALDLPTETVDEKLEMME